MIGHVAVLGGTLCVGGILQQGRLLSTACRSCCVHYYCLFSRACCGLCTVLCRGGAGQAAGSHTGHATCPLLFNIGPNHGEPGVGHWLPWLGPSDCRWENLCAQDRGQVPQVRVVASVLQFMREQTLLRTLEVYPRSVAQHILFLAVALCTGTCCHLQLQCASLM